MAWEHAMKLKAFISTVILAALGCTTAGAQAAHPDFGPNVLIFDSSMTNIQERVDAVFREQEKSEFGSNRYAFLFKPGDYHLDVKVGFYTEVLGSGTSPDAVSITGAVRSKADWRKGNATCNFWRCMENLSITPTLDQNIDVWAVSQGTEIRRVHVKGDMNLWDGGWASGGFLADCRIDGWINSGTQQQWFSRNSQFRRWLGGSWNMVFVGTVNPPEGNWPEKPYTTIEETPVSREKPYLFIDSKGGYFVMAPDLTIQETRGATWGKDASTPGMALAIDQFYLARPERDNAASINAALDHGKHLLFTPGVYHLEDSIHISRPNTVVLGLGYPTLIPDQGTPAMTVSDVDGVEVGGLILEAGVSNSATLLQVGEGRGGISHARNPVFLYDIFCRVGGASVGVCDSMVTLNCNDVVGDNFWLWRADHGAGASWDGNKNRNGLVVNGDNVTLYGLFVEHCQEYQTLWNGNGGRVYFYQSEMPYDPPSPEAWRHGDVSGFASYKVADNVRVHEAWGLGVYCVFYHAPIVAENAIETPAVPGVSIHHMITLRLNGRPKSGIRHVINGTGDSVITRKAAIVN